MSRLDSTLWWPTSGDVHVKMTYIAATIDAYLASARLVALVDGLQVSLRDANGAATVALPLSAPAGATTVFEFTIPEDAIGTGSHNLALVPINEASGQFTFGTLLTVIKGSAGFSDRRDDSAAAMELPLAAISGTVLSNNMQLYSGRPLASVTTDGGIPLDLPLHLLDGTGCSGTRIPVVATALVDFKQVSFDNIGPFVRVLPDGPHGYVLSVMAHGPPPDGTRHVLTVLQYPALEKKLGRFPQSPVEQNRLLYKLYLTVESQPKVETVHREYLLLRDWTGLAALAFVVLGEVGLYVAHWKVAAGYATAALVQYLVVRIAAANAGVRMVKIANLALLRRNRVQQTRAFAL